MWNDLPSAPSKSEALEGGHETKTPGGTMVDSGGTWATAAAMRANKSRRWGGEEDGGE
jgi:hypothetical protein